MTSSTVGFAASYLEARTWFLQAARRAGAALQAYWHPLAHGPDGDRLSIDLARLGRADATHILFTVCGTHGVEGYAGSAAQIQFLRALEGITLQPHVAVVFVHGLNPYGWSRDSQRNEDGTDLNRNFVDFADLPPADDELVARFAEVIRIDDMSFLALGRAVEALFALRDVFGADRFMRALAGGQYVEPTGIKYGGAQASWSNQVYRMIVREQLGNAQCVAELDWHTGLGDYGETFPICFADPASAEFAQTCDWWGRPAVERSAKSWSVSDDDAPAPTYNGLTHAALVEELPATRIAGGVIEFGTVPFSQIPNVIVLDNWLMTHGVHENAPFWRAVMRTIMAPRDPVWESAVLTHASRLCAATLDGLARWHA